MPATRTRRTTSTLTECINEQGKARIAFEQKLTERLDRLEMAQQRAADLVAQAQRTASTAQATATRAATTANRQPQSQTEDVHTKVVIAGFPRDQPRDLIDNVCRLFVNRTSLGKSLLSSSSSSSAGRAATIEAPYILGSVGHVETHNLTTAKRLVAELRAEQGLGGGRSTVLLAQQSDADQAGARTQRRWCTTSSV